MGGWVGTRGLRWMWPGGQVGGGGLQEQDGRCRATEAQRLGSAQQTRSCTPNAANPSLTLHDVSLPVPNNKPSMSWCLQAQRGVQTYGKGAQLLNQASRLLQDAEQNLMQTQVWAGSAPVGSGRDELRGGGYQHMFAFVLLCAQGSPCPACMAAVLPSKLSGSGCEEAPC